MKLSGTPDLSVVCFDVKDERKLSIYSVADGMKARGWNLNIVQFPSALHIAVTFANARNAGVFVSDMNASVDEALAHPGTCY